MRSIKKQNTHIEPFLDLLRQKCQEHVNPGIHIAIDEALILWKGRLRFRQFIKTKRSRFGIKVFLPVQGMRNDMDIPMISRFTMGNSQILKLKSLKLPQTHCHCLKRLLSQCWVILSVVVDM